MFYDTHEDGYITNICIVFIINHTGSIFLLYHAKPGEIRECTHFGRGSAFQVYFSSVHYLLTIHHCITVCYLLPKRHRTRQSSRGVVAGPRLHQMLKRWRILDPRGERVKVPEVAQGAQD